MFDLWILQARRVSNMEVCDKTCCCWRTSHGLTCLICREDGGHVCCFACSIGRLNDRSSME